MNKFNLSQAWRTNNNNSPKQTPHKHKKFVIQESKITEKQETPLNTIMNKKSIFEQLAEQVMNDDELDIIGANGGTEDVEVSSETTDESEGGDVTITLTADQVECLRSILDMVDGAGASDDEGEDDLGEEGADEGSDDFGDEESEEGTGEEDFDAFATEAIEAEEIGTPLQNMKKGNPVKPSAGSNKVQGKVTSMAKSGKANASVTDKVGNDGDEGTPLVNMKKGNPKKPSGGDNKVAGRASQVGSDLFA